MKKALIIIGSILGAAAVITAIIVILKKVKLKFSLDNTDDGFDFENDHDDISVSIEDDELAEELF
ncbi:MAG: hypothetical protein E7621_06150 [Ruminococcaceae bacterium]|nr:hypothetical protein [Oscillospiraceae bacterium]